MPTYDYRCENCNYQFETFQKMSEEPLKICPQCNGIVRRLISPGNGFIFKGSGFYTTDYRSDSYKKGQESATKKPNSEDKKEKKSKTKEAATA